MMPTQSGVFIHRSAIVDTDQVGRGTRVWAFAHVMEGAVVGTDCNIGEGSFVESGATVGNGVTIKNNSLIWHGVTIDDDVFIGPNTVFTNDLKPRAHMPSDPAEWLPTLVRVGASIGANSTILCGISVGSHAMIGAGSVVTKDVPSHALVAGNPARQIGFVCFCGERLSGNLECRACGRAYEDRSGEVREEIHG